MEEEIGVDTGPRFISQVEQIPSVTKMSGFDLARL
jgi:hypothetical protein